jgi:hypothetical protein
METLLKVCTLIHEIPPLCVLIVIPFLIFGLFKKEFVHIGINAVLIALTFVVFWVTEAQYKMWAFSEANYNEVLHSVSLIAYPVLFIAIYIHALKILVISVNKISKQKKRQSNSQSLSSTRLEAVG